MLGSCRSRKMLKNDYLDAKIGVDTAENEPCDTVACYCCAIFCNRKRGGRPERKEHERGFAPFAAVFSMGMIFFLPRTR